MCVLFFCGFFVVFVFVLACFVCVRSVSCALPTMLPVFLDCSSLIAPSGFSNVYITLSLVKLYDKRSAFLMKGDKMADGILNLLFSVSL